MFSSRPNLGSCGYISCLLNAASTTTLSPLCTEQMIFEYKFGNKLGPDLLTWGPLFYSPDFLTPWCPGSLYSGLSEFLSLPSPPLAFHFVAWEKSIVKGFSGVGTKAAPETSMTCFTIFPETSPAMEL